MNESLLLKISLFFSIFGIITLFLLVSHIESTDTTVKKLFQKDASTQVTGTLTSIQTNGKTTFLTISRPIEIKAIAFSKINLTVGQQVTISGKKEDDVIIIDKIILN